MRKRILILAAVVAVVLVSVASAAAPGSNAACSASPNPAALDSVVTISATGLPTIAPDYLIVTKPDGTRFFGGDYPLLVDQDGNATSNLRVDQAGTWTFDYSGMIKQRGKYFYTTVATCTDEVN